MTEKPNLPPSFWRELAVNNPLGVEMTPREARDWFDMVWLRYQTFGYRRHRRAITRWFSNLTYSELKRSRDRAEELENRKLADEQRAVNAESVPEPSNVYRLPQSHH